MPPKVEAAAQTVLQSGLFRIVSQFAPAAIVAFLTWLTVQSFGMQQRVALLEQRGLVYMEEMHRRVGEDERRILALESADKEHGQILANLQARIAEVHTQGIATLRAIEALDARLQRMQDRTR